VREFLKQNPDIANQIDAKLRAKLLPGQPVAALEEVLEAEA